MGWKVSSHLLEMCVIIPIKVKDIFFPHPDIHIHRACAQLMSRKIKWLWIKSKPNCSPNLIESYLVHLIRILNSNQLTWAPQMPAKPEPGGQEQVKVSSSPLKSGVGRWI